MGYTKDRYMELTGFEPVLSDCQPDVLPLALQPRKVGGRSRTSMMDGQPTTDHAPDDGQGPGDRTPLPGLKIRCLAD